MAQCFPPVEQLNRLRPPLMPGEESLLRALMQNLDDSYEIYVQPYLNGDRPDFVVMRKGSGVMVIEVKEWDLSLYKNPKRELEPWVLRSNGSRIRSPLEQAQQYKNNFYDLHLGVLFERNIVDKRSFAIVQPAVYFHNANHTEVSRFCGDVRYMHLLGSDDLTATGIAAVTAAARLDRSSRHFDDVLYSSFRRFLLPPMHEAEQGKAIRYTTRQAELIESRQGARQKIRGVAGCGKTKVLAARAVNAHRRTKSAVLVLTFNLTLRNYIHDRISEVRLPFPWSAFEITNYHQFIKTQANNLNVDFEDLLQAANNPDLFAEVASQIDRFDAILVDEVQDYETVWLSTLTKFFLAPDGEFVVFGDEKQNVYGRQMGADRFPRVPKVPGRWNQLTDSFRLDVAGMRIAQNFQRRYFATRYELDEDAVPRQQDILEAPATFRYRPALGVSGQELYRLVRSEAMVLGGHPNDLVVLAPTFETLRAIEFGYRAEARERTTNAGETQEEYASVCEKHGEDVESITRDLEWIRRGRKLHFWANAGTTKFSTIHSFKGWEAQSLILVLANLDSSDSDGSLDELIYVALTRVRGSLVVLDTVGGRYQSFFEEAFS